MHKPLYLQTRSTAGNITAVTDPRCQPVSKISAFVFNPLNAELNPICHLLALLGAHHILQAGRVRVITKNVGGTF
jgi:hypothetical protein